MTLSPLEPWIARKIGSGEALSRDALANWQLGRLRETIELARSRSPFYRERLAGCAPVSSLSDIARLPLTTSGDLRSDPQRFVCVSQSEISRIVTLPTSGTTGSPKRLYFTAADIELTLDFFAAGMSTFTGRGDRVLILLPGETPDSVGDLLCRSLVRIGAAGVKHGPVRDAAETLALARRERITVMVGIPTQVLELAACSGGRNFPPVHSVLLTADYVPEAIMRAVERAWSCKTYNHYGMTETGLGGGVDCAARRGYHLREADVYYEIIDPGTGSPLPEGERGEIVVTTLTRSGMPLLRYRTGDYSRWLPGGCPCGTVLRTMEHVRGRAGQAIALGGGLAVTLADLDDILFALDGLLDYRATVGRCGDARRLGIRFRAAPGSPACQSGAIRAALGRFIKDGSLVLGSVEPRDRPWTSGGAAKRTLQVEI